MRSVSAAANRKSTKPAGGTRVLACGENSHALRLENVSLREPLSDLRAGNANLIRYTFGVRNNGAKR